MWDREGLQAMDDHEKMDDDKEENTNEESRYEEQEEEHQKERAIASPDIQSRSWCTHCLRGRGRRSAHKRRHNEGEGGTVLITYTSLKKLMRRRDTEEQGRPEEARRIVGVDRED